MSTDPASTDGPSTDGPSTDGSSTDEPGTAAPGVTSAPPSGAVPSIAFFEPRIPQNTGNAIRLAAVTGAMLHLVEPLGFDLSEPKLRRAGLDYHDLANVVVHRDLEALLASAPASRVLAFTTRATARYTDVAYEASDILLFGPEPTGLDDAVLAHERVTAELRIPMLPGRRSLNLTSSASIVVYEAWRQLGFVGGR